MDVGGFFRRLFWKIMLRADGGQIGKNFSCYSHVVFMQNTPGSIRIGDNFRVLRNCTLNTIENGQLEIGNNVYIGESTLISAYSHIRIGNYVVMGQQNIIADLAHGFDRLDVPIRLQPWIGKPITIEDDVWIASNCVILPGVTVGKGSVIGAGSVVTKDVVPYSVMVGNPARLLKSRKPAANESLSAKS